MAVANFIIISMPTCILFIFIKIHRFYNKVKALFIIWDYKARD